MYGDMFLKYVCSTVHTLRWFHLRPPEQTQPLHIKTNKPTKQRDQHIEQQSKKRATQRQGNVQSNQSLQKRYSRFMLGLESLELNSSAALNTNGLGNYFAFGFKLLEFW